MFNHSATSPRVFLSWRGRFPFHDFFVSASPPPHPVFFLSRRGRFPFKDFSFLRVRHLTPFPCECVFVVAVAFFALVRRDFGSRRIAGLALARRDRASSRSSRFPCDSATYYADWCTMAAQLDQIAA